MQQIQSIFNAQQKTRLQLRTTTAPDRITKLKKLKKGIEDFEEELYTAMQSDLRKCRFETAVTEIYFTYAEIDHAIKHLKNWMTPRSVAGNFTNLFTDNKIYYEPKGCCLIIAPWNYPFQLLMSPLISALAAGNCCVLKPSELSSATASVISKMIGSLFSPDEVACVEGGVEVSQELLALPFDHIFFTGSTAIGKVVMEAAAKNLSSVTLELGGKSPVIIDTDADLKKAAKKIAWGKLVNAGQTCIAPDYVLLHEASQAQFIDYYKDACNDLFFKNGEIDLQVYGKIINKKQFDRLVQLIKDAERKGARMVQGGESDEASLTILPTLMTHVDVESAVMKEEIFGPVLPLVTYKKIEEAVDFVNSRSKPLALYIFSDNKKQREKILRTTSAGGTCVNDVLIHISNPNLPFGGVNSSGMGNCHGIYGFKTFSHERAVMVQSAAGLTKMIYPPYDKKNRLLKWLKKLI